MVAKATTTERVWIPIVQCGWCNAVKVGRWYLSIPRMPTLKWERWISLPQMPAIEVSTTHGVCPTCIEKMKAEMRHCA